MYIYSIEIIYDIISILNDNQAGVNEQLTSNNEKDCYRIFTRKYNIIYDKLKNASEYYNRFKMKFPIDRIFGNSVQMRLLTEESCFSSPKEKKSYLRLDWEAFCWKLKEQDLFNRDKVYRGRYYG